jgi:hypothetical protein
MDREYSTLGKKRTAYSVLVRKPVGRHTRELEDNIKMDRMG